jgi:hypothetical protein
LQGRISFHDQSLKCNARVLLPPFQYLSITLSSASSTFSIWEKMRGAVGWCRLTKPLTTSCFNVVYLKNGQPAQFQWNLIISHIFPIFNDHSTGAIPLFHLETAWRRR